MKTIDFYFDIWSPYAYLAFHRIRKVAREHSCEIRYLPINIQRAKQAAGNTGPANIEIPSKIQYLMQDLKRWADRYGVPFGKIPAGKGTDRINKGVFFARDNNAEEAYIEAAYAAVWGRGEAPNSDAVLTSIAQQFDWDPATFLDFLDSESANSRYENVFSNAVDRDVFGVPIMIVDDKMWWGNDRLPMLEEHLVENA